MSDYGFDGMIKVSFVPIIANFTAPKLTELNAGIPLEGRLTADGLDISTATANIDTSKLKSTTNSSVIGRDTHTVSVKYVRGDDTEAQAVQDALVRGAKGVLAVRRTKLATVAWTVGDDIELYPVQCERPNPDKPAANALQGVTVGMQVTDGGNVRAIDDTATAVA